MISADYVIVIEKAEGNYGDWCPDLPGVVALGETEDECVESMGSAIAFHIEGLIEDGDPVPPPAAVAARTVHIEDRPYRSRLNRTWGRRGQVAVSTIITWSSVESAHHK